MASGRRHWRAALARLATAQEPSASQRRRMRKLLGRLHGREWRVFGHQSLDDAGRRVIPLDALTVEIATRTKQQGHVGTLWAERQTQPGSPPKSSSAWRPPQSRRTSA